MPNENKILYYLLLYLTASRGKGERTQGTSQSGTRIAQSRAGTTTLALMTILLESISFSAKQGSYKITWVIRGLWYPSQFSLHSYLVLNCDNPVTITLKILIMGQLKKEQNFANSCIKLIHGREGIRIATKEALSIVATYIFFIEVVL